MTAIKVFQLVQIFFENLGLYSPQSNQIYSSKLRMLIFLTFPLLDFIAMSGFLILKVNTIQDFGVCFYATASIALCLVDSIIAARRIPQIIKLIRNFEDFIAKRSHHSHSAVAHKNLIEKIERMSKLNHLILVEISSSAAMISPLLVTFIDYFVLGMGNASFHFDGTMLFPFDANKPIGFFVATSFQWLAIRAVFCNITPIASVYIGSCWSIVTFLKDIARDISHLKKKRIFNLSKEKLTRRFRNFMRYHANVQDLTAEFNKIYEFITFVTFLWGLSTVACSLIAFQASMNNGNPIELFMPFCLMIWSFVTMYYNCEMGQHVSNQFNKFSDDIDKCDWYALPHKLQRVLIIIIINAQEPVSIRGFGNVVCTRDSFKQTIHAGFSYFMMLHQMDE